VPFFGVTRSADQGIYFHFPSYFHQAVKIAQSFYIVFPAAPFAYGAATAVAGVYADHPVYADKRFEFLFAAAGAFWKHVGYIQQGKNYSSQCGKADP
jgi:hypothetical protein